MMQLDQQSRWQSWMRMLAVGIRPAQESARSWVPRSGVSHGSYSVADGGTLIATERYSSKLRKDS